MCKIVNFVISSLALLSLVSGCTSVTVKKLDPLSKNRNATIDGVRYSLPAPFVSIAPQSDGTIVPDSLTVPDASNSYAIDAFTLGGAYALDIKLDRGIIQSVKFTQDVSAVPTTLTNAAGDFVKGQLDAKAKSQSDFKQKLADAEKVVSDAQLQVDLAQDKLNKASANDRPAADLELSQDKIKLQAAKGALAKLQKAGPSPVAGAAPGATTPAGPILYYRLFESPLGVELKRVDVPVLP